MPHSTTQSRSEPKLQFGTDQCKCSHCGEYFGNVVAFDLHRTGDWPDRHCKSPETVQNSDGHLLLTQNEQGFWVETQ